MWLATETMVGVALLATAITIEVAGLALEHCSDKS